MTLSLRAIPDTFNMVSLLVDRHSAEGRGDKVAIYCGDERITYQSLFENVNRTGNALKALGVERENRVMLLLNDTPAFFYAFLGAMKIGAVPVPVNVLATPDDYAFYLNDARAGTLIVDAEYWPKIVPIRSRLKYLTRVVIANTARDDWRPSERLDELLAASSADLEAEPTSKDDPSYWLYSSGTTGTPKGVVHLHHDMVYCVDAYARQVIGMTEDDVNFSVPKLFFSYGLVNSLYLPLWAGAAVVLLPTRPEPKTTIGMLEKFRPTLFFSVPTSYAQLLNTIDAPTGVQPLLERKRRLSSVRLCVSAGEALPEPIYRRWKEKFGVDVLDGIGSSEIGYICISNRPNRIRPGSSGELIDGYAAKATDEQGRELPRGEIGDLWVKGDSICAMYWNRHELTQRTIHGEWIRTGDKYIVDGDGYFWYQGRSDDMLKVGGQWVSPLEVESALLTHESVAECAVVGAKDSDGMVKPKAFVVLKNGLAPSVGDLQNHVKQKIAPYKYPRWIEFTNELPKTATGKVRRFKLRE